MISIMSYALENTGIELSERGYERTRARTFPRKVSEE